MSTVSQILSTQTLASARAHIPSYDREALSIRVLHIGPGAFFRAHQVDYFDRLNALDPRWGIEALSLRSPQLAETLEPQDGLYTLVTLEREVSFRVVGALKRVTFVDAPDASIERSFLNPALTLVTLTVTEKGYCLNAVGELDRTHADIVHDIATPASPVSAVGVLVLGLRSRRDAGLDAPIVLSCDNLPSNGVKLRDAVVSFARVHDEALADWIATHVKFPCSMVDSITPASDELLVSRVEAATGLHDAWPIQREGFTSWVIEKIDDKRLPELERVGAVLTNDVDGHEQAKLRMLNGPHSLIAYVGLARGFETVAGAMQDGDMVALTRSVMRDEIAPSLSPPEGLDLGVYADALIERFRNPAVAHKLSQIAWDGSQKIPIRLLATIADNLSAGRAIDGLMLGVAAWCRFVVRTARNGDELVDPIDGDLLAIGQAVQEQPQSDTELFLTLRAVFPASLADNTTFRMALVAAYQEVMDMENQEEVCV